MNTKARAVREMISLGLRCAWGAGRSSGRVRSVLLAGAAALTAAMLWLVVAANHVVSAELQREAQRQPALASDPRSVAGLDETFAILRVDDVWRGRPLDRLLLAALGTNALPPPGLDRLPSSGEVYVSPRIASSIAEDAGLAARFAGRTVRVIKPEGLTEPDEPLVYQSMTTPDLDQVLSQDVARAGFGLNLATGWGGSGSDQETGVKLHILAGFALLVVVPAAAVFIAATRFAGEQVDKRLSALRLLGLSRRDIMLVGATETAAFAAMGAIAGIALAIGVRPAVAQVRLPSGQRVFADDLLVPWIATVGIVVGVVVLAAAVGAFVTGSVGRPSSMRAGAVRHRRAAGFSLTAVGILSLLVTLLPPVGSSETLFGVAFWVGIVSFGLGLPLTLAAVGERLGRFAADRPKASVVGLLCGRRLNAEAGVLTRLVAAAPVLIFAAGCATAFVNRTEANSRWAAVLTDNDGHYVVGAVDLLPGTVEPTWFAGLDGVRAVLPVVPATTTTAGDVAVGGAIVATCDDLQHLAPLGISDCAEEPQLISTPDLPAVVPPGGGTVVRIDSSGTPITVTARSSVAVAGAKLGALSALIKLPPADLTPMPARRLLISVDGHKADVIDRVRSILAAHAPSATLEVPDESSLRGAAGYARLGGWARLGLLVAAGIALCGIAIGLADQARTRSSIVTGLRRLGASRRVLYVTQLVVVAAVLGLGLGLAILGAALATYAYAATGGDPYPTAALFLLLGLGAALSCLLALVSLGPIRTSLTTSTLRPQ